MYKLFLFPFSQNFSNKILYKFYIELYNEKSFTVYFQYKDAH